MSATAALRTGCGLVTVAVPESQRAIVAQAMPELMTHGLTHETNPLLIRFGYTYEIQGFTQHVAKLFGRKP